MNFGGFLNLMFLASGERGIRTPGPVTVNSFQDYRNRPLCHLSAAKVQLFYKLQILKNDFIINNLEQSANKGLQIIYSILF